MYTQKHFLVKYRRIFLLQMILLQQHRQQLLSQVDMEYYNHTSKYFPVWYIIVMLSTWNDIVTFYYYFRNFLDKEDRNILWRLLRSLHKWIRGETRMCYGFRLLCDIPRGVRRQWVSAVSIRWHRESIISRILHFNEIR